MCDERHECERVVETECVCECVNVHDARVLYQRI